jgi:hypothetical protein
MRDGETDKPALLRRLNGMGVVPGEILWRYEKGYCRQGQSLKAATIGVYMTSCSLQLSEIPFPQTRLLEGHHRTK